MRWEVSSMTIYNDCYVGSSVIFMGISLSTSVTYLTGVERSPVEVCSSLSLLISQLGN
jgi:hypothetical protein